jgi:hypothetical protein
VEAVTLIEQIGPQGHPILQQRMTGAGAECCIGRDLGCEIVVDDEHAAPRHARLTLLEDGRVRVEDLGTKNGTRVDGRRVPADGGAVIAQGELIVGRTRLHVRTRHTPLGPERVFRREFVRRHRSWLAAAGVAACLAFAGFHQWLDAPVSLLWSVTAGVLVALGVLAVWTAGWCLLSKLNKGKWEVRIHLGIAAVGVAFCAWGYWIAGLVAYTAQWSVLARVGIAVVAATALAALYLHLREATAYGRRISLALAGAGTLLISAIAWVATLGMTTSDVNRVDLGPDVRIGVARVVPNRDIADYLAEVERLRREAGRERQRSLLEAPLADSGD